MKISRLEKNGQKLPTATFVSREDFISDNPIKLREEFLQELALSEIKSYQKQIEMSGESTPGYVLEGLKRHINYLQKKYFNQDPEQNFNNLTESEEYLEHDYEDQYDSNSDRQIILNLNEEFPNYDIERIYKKIYLRYKSAMERKEGRKSLTFEGFFRHYFEEDLSGENKKIFGNDSKGYLLGIEEYNTFIPMHFAPAGLRIGASLINDLNENGIPTCFFIPEDLRDTIIKLPGWKTVNYQIPMNFRGKTVIKYPVFNNIKAVVGIIQKQLRLLKVKYKLKEEFKNFVGKVSMIFKKRSNEFQDEILEEILKELETKRGY